MKTDAQIRRETVQALRKCAGSRVKAGRLLGIGGQAVSARIRKHGITQNEYLAKELLEATQS